MGVGTTLGGECCASENKLKLQNACVIILENKEGLKAQTYREDKYDLSSLTAHVGEKCTLPFSHYLRVEKTLPKNGDFSEVDKSEPVVLKNPKKNSWIANGEILRDFKFQV